jgi:hypothetical protein
LDRRSAIILFQCWNQELIARYSSDRSSYTWSRTPGNSGGSLLQRFSNDIPAYEQFPLSAEIINNGLLHRIDSRFNLVFFERMVVHYPYLLNATIREHGYLAHVAVMTEYTNAFFLHFAYRQSFAQFLNPIVFSM